MNNIIEIIRFTIRESLSKKVFLVLGIIATLFILGIFLIPLGEISTTILSENNQIPSEYNLGDKILFFFQLKFLSAIGGFGLLALTFANSGLFASILEKGTIDLFLSKPINRTELLIGRYLGGITVSSIILFYLIGGVWLSSSIKMNYYNFNFLILLISLVFNYSIMSSIVMLFSVISKSGIPGLIITFFIYFSSSFLASREMVYQFINNEVLKNVINTVYYILPKITQINDYISTIGDTKLVNEVLNQTLKIGSDSYTMIFASSALFWIVVSSLAIKLINKKDF